MLAMNNQFKQVSRQEDNMIYKDQNKGAALLLVVIILGVAALIIGLNASFLGLGSLELGYTGSQGGASFSAADGCIEEGLRQLQIDPLYDGGTLSLGGGACILTISGSQSVKQLRAQTTVNNLTSIIIADIIIEDSGTIILTDWRKE